MSANASQALSAIIAKYQWQARSKGSTNIITVSREALNQDLGDLQKQKLENTQKKDKTPNPTELKALQNQERLLRFLLKGTNYEQISKLKNEYAFWGVEYRSDEQVSIEDLKELQKNEQHPLYIEFEKYLINPSGSEDMFQNMRYAYQQFMNAHVALSPDKRHCVVLNPTAYGRLRSDEPMIDSRDMAWMKRIMVKTQRKKEFLNFYRGFEKYMGAGIVSKEFPYQHVQAISSNGQKQDSYSSPQAEAELDSIVADMEALVLWGSEGEFDPIQQSLNLKINSFIEHWVEDTLFPTYAFIKKNSKNNDGLIDMNSPSLRDLEFILEYLQSHSQSKGQEYQNQISAFEKLKKTYLSLWTQMMSRNKTNPKEPWIPEVGRINLDDSGKWTVEAVSTAKMAPRFVWRILSWTRKHPEHEFSKLIQTKMILPLDNKNSVSPSTVADNEIQEKINLSLKGAWDNNTLFNLVRNRVDHDILSMLLMLDVYEDQLYKNLFDEEQAGYARIRIQLKSMEANSSATAHGKKYNINAQGSYQSWYNQKIKSKLPSQSNQLPLFLMADAALAERRYPEAKKLFEELIFKLVQMDQMGELNHYSTDSLPIPFSTDMIRFFKLGINKILPEKNQLSFSGPYMLDAAIEKFMITLVLTGHEAELIPALSQWVDKTKHAVLRLYLIQLRLLTDDPLQWNRAANELQALNSANSTLPQTPEKIFQKKLKKYEMMLKIRQNQFTAADYQDLQPWLSDTDNWLSLEMEARATHALARMPSSTTDKKIADQKSWYKKSIQSYEKLIERMGMGSPHAWGKGVTDNINLMKQKAELPRYLFKNERMAVLKEWGLALYELSLLGDVESKEKIENTYQAVMDPRKLNKKQMPYAHNLLSMLSVEDSEDASTQINFRAQLGQLYTDALIHSGKFQAAFDVLYEMDHLYLRGMPNMDSRKRRNAIVKKLFSDKQQWDRENYIGSREELYLYQSQKKLARLIYTRADLNEKKTFYLKWLYFHYQAFFMRHRLRKSEFNPANPHARVFSWEMFLKTLDINPTHMSEIKDPKLEHFVERMENSDQDQAVKDLAFYYEINIGQFFAVIEEMISSFDYQVGEHQEIYLFLLDKIQILNQLYIRDYGEDQTFPTLNALVKYKKMEVELKYQKYYKSQHQELSEIQKIEIPVTQRLPMAVYFQKVLFWNYHKTKDYARFLKILTQYLNFQMNGSKILSKQEIQNYYLQEISKGDSFLVDPQHPFQAIDIEEGLGLLEQLLHPSLGEPKLVLAASQHRLMLYLRAALNEKKFSNLPMDSFTALAQLKKSIFDLEKVVQDYTVVEPGDEMLGWILFSLIKNYLKWFEALPIENPQKKQALLAAGKFFQKFRSVYPSIAEHSDIVWVNSNEKELMDWSLSFKQQFGLRSDPKNPKALLRELLADSEFVARVEKNKDLPTLSLEQKKSLIFLIDSLKQNAHLPWPAYQLKLKILTELYPQQLQRNENSSSNMRYEYLILYRRLKTLFSVNEKSLDEFLKERPENP